MVSISMFLFELNSSSYGITTIYVYFLCFQEFIFTQSLVGDIRCVYRKPFALLSITTLSTACLFPSSYSQFFHILYFIYNSFLFFFGQQHFNRFVASYYYLLPQNRSILEFLYSYSIRQLIVRSGTTFEQKHPNIDSRKLFEIDQILYIQNLFESISFLIELETVSPFASRKKRDFLILFISVYICSCCAIFVGLRLINSGECEKFIDTDTGIDPALFFIGSFCRRQIG